MQAAARHPYAGFRALRRVQNYVCCDALASAKGHVPRGFCGATGTAEDVSLVLVVAEPGDPYAHENYSSGTAAEDVFAEVCRRACQSFSRGTGQFHKNIRGILDECWPSLTFDQQLHHAWITESVLCSALTECGPVPPIVTSACGNHYLYRQLALFPGAVVVALGGKAQDRLRRSGRAYLPVGSVAPPGCNQRQVKESWNRIAPAVHSLSARPS